MTRFGLTGTYSYHNGARLTGINYTSDGGTNTIDTLGWGYNAGNLVTGFSSSDGTASYGYDPTNQLTSATYTTAQGGHQPANESYSYTANGNRDSTGYSTGSDNLITSDGTFNYQHDADGNTTVRTRISDAYATDYRTTFTWDYRNRLTDVDYYDNNGVLSKHVHYVYDVFNDLIGEEDDDTGRGAYDNEQWYVNEGGQPALVFNGSGDLIGRNLIAPSPSRVDEVMAQEAVSSLSSGGAITYMVDDNLGTPRDDVDSTGTLVNHAVFNSVGQEVYQSNSSVINWNGFGGGHLSASTALVLDGLRWLDPTTAKWLSNDPSGFAGHDANLSRFVGNDPTNAIDPMGLSPWTLTMTGGGFYTSTGGTGHHWSIVGNGISTFGMDYTPGLNVGSFGTVTSMTSSTWTQNWSPQGPAAGPGFAGHAAGAAGGALYGSSAGFIAGGLGVIAGIAIVGTAPLWAPIGTVVLVGAGVGMLLGGAIGACSGAQQTSFDAGYNAAANNPLTTQVPFMVGAGIGMYPGSPPMPTGGSGIQPEPPPVTPGGTPMPPNGGVIQQPNILGGSQWIRLGPSGPSMGGGPLPGFDGPIPPLPPGPIPPPFSPN